MLVSTLGKGCPVNVFEMFRLFDAQTPKSHGLAHGRAGLEETIFSAREVNRKQSSPILSPSDEGNDHADRHPQFDLSGIPQGLYFGRQGSRRSIVTDNFLTPSVSDQSA